MIENWNGANSFIFYGKSGDFATNRLDEQELAALSLHLLQICLVYILSRDSVGDMFIPFADFVTQYATHGRLITTPCILKTVHVSKAQRTRQQFATEFLAS